MTVCQRPADSADPFQGVMQVSFSFLEGLDSARALSVKLLADAYLPNDPEVFSEQIKSLFMNPQGYLDYDIQKFRADYQATCLFSKLPSPCENPALRAAAIAGFEEGEERLKLVNSFWLNESKVEASLYKLGVDLQELRKIIKGILGRAPSLKKLAKRAKWTTGSSFLLNRFKSNEAAKCEFGVSCTLPLAKKIAECLDADDIPLINWSSRLVLAPGNLVDTVPKNITTDRTIAKEPEINMFFQNALGSLLKELLLAVGIDLKDQGNNQWACMMAMKCSLATLDLRNASNSVSCGLVYCLLPPDWVELIMLLRSERGTFGSRKEVAEGEAVWFDYEMISSMGNGFTFELETLLFFAICLSTGCPDWATYVYGDDIIIPQKYVPKVVPVLELCGFSLNTEKSFLEGTFFESCGYYAFNGVEVTPIKIKALLYGPKDCIVLANKIRWFSHVSSDFVSCDRRLLPAWQACLRRLPEHIRSVAHGPVGYGLGVWKNRNEVPYSPHRPKSTKKPWFQAERLQELRAQVKTRSVFHAGVSIAAQARVRASDYYDEGFTPSVAVAHGNKVPLFVEGFALGSLYHNGSTWYDLGIWR